MNITLEKIIEIVTREVINELAKKGIIVNGGLSTGTENNARKSLEVDMSMYKTPLLTENTIELVEPDVIELIVPEKTVITPGAAYLIKKREIKLNYKS